MKLENKNRWIKAQCLTCTAKTMNDRADFSKIKRNNVCTAKTLNDIADY